MSSEQPFACPRSTCFRTFSTYLGVRRHLQRYHKFTMEEVEAQRKKVFYQRDQALYSASRRILHVSDGTEKLSY